MTGNSKIGEPSAATIDCTEDLPFCRKYCIEFVWKRQQGESISLWEGHQVHQFVPSFSIHLLVSHSMSGTLVGR